MSPIGARFDQLPAQSVVKLVDEIGIALPSLGRGHLFHGMRFPKSATVAKGGKSTLGAHTGAGEYHDFFLLCCHIIYHESTLQKYAFFKLYLPIRRDKVRREREKNDPRSHYRQRMLTFASITYSKPHS